MRSARVRLSLVVICLAGLGRFAFANSAAPDPVEVEQPAGAKVTLFFRGNEKLHWYEFVPEAANFTLASMEDPANRELARKPGFTVVQDAQGRYVYATLDENGEWAPTNRVVGQDDAPTEVRRLMPTPPARLRMATPRLQELGIPERAGNAVGEVRNLVVLMRFADHGSRPLPKKADFETLFNKPGGDPALAPTGSVFDFYNENSYGKLKLSSTVVDWVTLPRTEAYYADGQSGMTVRVREAMTDALRIIASKGLVNFKDFDKDNGGAGDGWIDAITFVHSGYAAEFGGVAGGVDYKKRIWSHRWVIDTWTDPKSGVRVRDYNINPGIWGTSGYKIGHIGVICHELGHFFGLPDLYDYSGDGEGVGTWCLMANSWGFDGTQLRPPHMSAWSKVELGWNVADVISEQKVYTVTPTTQADAKIYRWNYPSGSPSEYLLIENRQPVGQFDGGIPSGMGGRGGLLIWHIDDAKPENNMPGFPGQPGWPANGNHYKVALLQADGKYDLEHGVNRGDANDPYRAGHVDSISPMTVPSSNSYAGVAGPLIQQISASSNSMTFRLGQESQTADSKAVFIDFVNIEVPESHVSVFSEDHKAATLIFDRLYSNVYGTDHVNTTKAAFVLPVKEAPGKVGVRLQGYVIADEGSTVALMVQINGHAEIVDLEAARDPSIKFESLHEPAKKAIQALRSTGEIAEGYSWTKNFEVEVPAETALTVTAVLITEKRTKQSSGSLVTIDVLDAELTE